nr:hypothetical protein [Tanacetum cinerariifolium]
VYCGNVSAVYLSSNPVQHQRMKHIEIDIHFVRDLVAAGQVRVLHVLSCYQYADIFTKGLPSALFEGGTLNRYKARLVANDSTLVEGVDVDETFSLVVKPGTIRTILSLAISRHWPVHQLDVKNAFLHSDLSETVYIHQPLGFRDFTHPDYVCLLKRSLYGLKQRKYATEILEQAHMVGCNPSRTPVDTESKFGNDGDPVSDSTLYRSLAGSLQYLTFTRPDISYAAQQVCLHMHDPIGPHFSALNRVLRYVRVGGGGDED